MIRGPLRWSRGLGFLRLPRGWELRIRRLRRRDEAGQILPGRIYGVTAQRDSGSFVSLELEIAL